ncbi:toprim domain-containing protein [Mesorhizobium sp. NZP2077]|uniref:DUF7146 domain-containing protein n=1 Tax=Mesorhizobium sp. NZP2077 TaxID=2483404 RepID=UPI001556BA27|nr:toprim domain-containing protein [Mesorhizobium sp. NZP2077]QKC86962.1 DNA primase [Mesorhizobium sp. NZP2077]QKD20661.1 DNA primase [Mesorhizobium sp. NZP2077]
MPRDASELARRLARDAEAVCRHYLSNGRRQGRYWMVGDVRNTPGRSMFVRLSGPEAGPGAAGHWTDAASAQHGDLLDVIRESCDLAHFRDVTDEARRFLSLPRPEPVQAENLDRTPVAAGSSDAARRLFAASRPISGTMAERYLHGRRLIGVAGLACLRFHPRCYYRPDEADPPATHTAWPALIAAVADLAGTITGVHRTWLDPDGGKAPLATPRRAMGHLLGHAVRFGVPEDVLAVGEGIETVLSVREALPNLPLAAALSSNHLAAMLFPEHLRVLYILRDADPAGDATVAALTAKAEAAAIEPRVLSPYLNDFNDDLCHAGLSTLRAKLVTQLRPKDVERFSRPALGVG